MSIYTVLMYLPKILTKMNKSILITVVILRYTHKFFDTPSSRKWNLNPLPPLARGLDADFLLINRLWKEKK